MKFFLIGDKETVTAFSLAGIEGVVVESETQILANFQREMIGPDKKIFLITERLAERVRPFLNTLLLRKGGPLILEITDRQGPLPGKRSVEGLVLSALGIKI